MSRRTVESLRDGDSLRDDVFLAADKQQRTNRKGDPFVQVELRDRTGGIPARMWNAGDGVFRSFENGDYVEVEGKVQNFQGSLQVVLTHIERAAAEKVDTADFLPLTPTPIPQLMDRARAYLLGLTNPHLRALGEAVLMDDALMRAYAACPAGVKLHHAAVGGLLEHAVTMMDITASVAPHYPGVDKELALVGAFLHDVGKVRELAYARAFGYTDEGQLLGHITLGVEILTEKLLRAAELTGEPVPRELTVRLKHMLLSHHGTLEYGSPKVPMTPEAMLLHLVDTLDTRMHMVLRDLKEDRNNQTAWTPYNTSLQRRLYKGGANGDLIGERSDTFD